MANLHSSWTSFNIKIRDFFFADSSRWILWWPVGMGIGIVSYFALFREPSFTQCFVPFSCFVIALFFQKKFILKAILLIGLSVSFGFLSAKIRTELIGISLLEEPLKNISLIAEITSIEETDRRLRLTLATLSPPIKKYRLTIPQSEKKIFKIGQHITGTADLLPFSPPSIPGGFNSRQQAFFEGIEATGTLKNIKIIGKTPPATLLQYIDHVRYYLTTTLRQNLPRETAEIAAALITGEKSGIDKNIRQAFSNSGLAHILAISGLHLSLLAGLAFFIFRRGLCLFPLICERYNVKKGAALIVIIITLAYLCISGFGIPAQRAYMMIFLAMFAIFLDRHPLSMRSVMFAATIILIIRPESLLSASFQLSFAAVIALIAFYESGWIPLKTWAAQGGIGRKITFYFSGLFVTTLIASLATLPLTLYIFNTFTLQSISANLIAIPITGFIIIPAAFLSIVSLIFGGNSFCFDTLHFGIKSLTSVATTVAEWPGANILVAKPSSLFLVFITLGFLWLCLWQERWRYWGVIPIVAAFILLFRESRPNILMAADGSIIAYRQQNTLFVSSLEKGHFYREQWAKTLGIRDIQEWPHSTIFLTENIILTTNKKIPYPFLKKSEKEKIILSNQYISKRIKLSNAKFVDKKTLKNQGTITIRILNNTLIPQSMHAFIGNRPWA